MLVEPIVRLERGDTISYHKILGTKKKPLQGKIDRITFQSFYGTMIYFTDGTPLSAQKVLAVWNRHKKQWLKIKVREDENNSFEPIDSI